MVLHLASNPEHFRNRAFYLPDFVDLLRFWGFDIFLKRAAVHVVEWQALSRMATISSAAQLCPVENTTTLSRTTLDHNKPSSITYFCHPLKSVCAITSNLVMVICLVTMSH